MDRRKKWNAAAELAAVSLLTAVAFVCAKQAALIERGYSAYGGEYLLLMIPLIYYMAEKDPLLGVSTIIKQALIRASLKVLWGKI